MFCAEAVILLQQLGACVCVCGTQHQVCLYLSDGTKLKNRVQVCTVSLSWWETPHTPPPLPLKQSACSAPLVGMWPARVWGHCGPPAPPLSMISPAVTQDTVSAATPFVIVFSLAFGGWLSELPGLLINTAALWRPPPQVLVVNCVTGPLHLLLSLPLPQLDCQAASLLLGRRWGARLNSLRYRLTWRPGNLRHPCSCLANANVS